MVEVASRRKRVLKNFQKHMTYDAIGRRTGMTDLVGTTTYTYDAANRLLSKTQYGKTVAYAYDAANRLTARTDAAGMATVNSYDHADRLMKAVMGSMSVAFTYDAASRVTTKAFSNGLSCVMTYDNDNRVLSMTWTGGACHADGSNTTYAYSYDAVGNRVSDTETDGRQTRLAWTYTVDSLNRLVSATLNGSSITNWSIDAVGNILSESTGPVQKGQRSGGCDGQGGTLTDTFAVNAKDQVTAVDGAALTWDADGNLLTKPDPNGWGRPMQFTWDAEDRLIQIAFADGSKETNAYDGDGRRVSTTDRWGQAATFVWSGGDVLDDYDRQNNPCAIYLLTGSVVQGNTGWGSDPRCDIQAFRNQAPTTFYVSDGMANVRQVADGQGNVATSFDYQTYGQLLTAGLGGQGFGGFGFDFGGPASITDSANPYRYVGTLGARYDPNSGMYYMRKRWMDPILRRFVSRDLVSSTNLYEYADCSPNNFTDPSGMIPGGPVDISAEELAPGDVKINLSYSPYYPSTVSIHADLYRITRAELNKAERGSTLTDSDILRIAGVDPNSTHGIANQRIGTIGHTKDCSPGHPNPIDSITSNMEFNDGDVIFAVVHVGPGLAMVGDKMGAITQTLQIQALRFDARTSTFTRFLDLTVTPPLP